MILPCHPVNPEKRTVQRILDGLNRGGIFIVPTDGVYAFICHPDQPRAIASLYRIKDMPEKQPLSLLCRDISMAGVYTRSIPDFVFRFMKSHTPGPYTFILPASKEMDRRGLGKRREVGIRIVDHPLHYALMSELDVPLVSTSVPEVETFVNHPETIEKIYGGQVEAVVDGGPRKNEYTTVLECTNDRFVLLRAGLGSIDSVDYLVEEREAAAIEPEPSENPRRGRRR